jgi:hypothetical protein
MPLSQLNRRQTFPLIPPEPLVEKLEAVENEKLLPFGTWLLNREVINNSMTFSCRKAYQQDTATLTRSIERSRHMTWEGLAAWIEHSLIDEILKQWKQTNEQFEMFGTKSRTTWCPLVEKLCDLSCDWDRKIEWDCQLDVQQRVL